MEIKEFCAKIGITEEQFYDRREISLTKTF